jgi:hypothetical protein
MVAFKFIDLGLFITMRINKTCIIFLKKNKSQITFYNLLVFFQ